MSKLTDLPPLSREAPNPNIPDYCTKNGAARLGTRIVEYHAERGRRIEVRIRPVEAPFGGPNASNRMYRVTSDIDPVRMR